jgi:hypothetical protein
VVLVAWALYAVVPLLVTQASGLAQQAPDVVLALRDKAQVYLENFMTTLTDEDKLKLRQTLEGYSGQAFELLKLLAAKVWQSGSAVFGAVSFLLVMPVVAFYLMKDWPAITTTIKNLLPRRQAPIILEQMHQIDRTLASFSTRTINSVRYSGDLLCRGTDAGWAELRRDDRHHCRCIQLYSFRRRRFRVGGITRCSVYPVPRLVVGGHYLGHLCVCPAGGKQHHHA